MKNYLHFGQQWQAIESDLAKERMKTAQSDRTNLTGVQNFAQANEKGKVRDIIAKRVGLGSGYNYQKALQVVEFLDRLCESEKTEIAKALKRILNESSINAAHKVLSMADKERERILELIASNKALTIKEAQKLLKDLNPPPETEIQLAEGMKMKVDRTSPICPGLKGEITSLPNSSSAIVFFEDGTRQMVDRGYIKPALEDLPQSLIARSTRVSSPTTPTTQSQTTEKTQSQTTSFDEPKSVKEELDKKQEELGLGKRRQSVLPESDRLDDWQHQNPTDIDDRPFTNPISFTEEDSQELTILVANIKKTVKFLRKEDYRSIGYAIVQNKPEGVEELIKTFAKNRATKKLVIIAQPLLNR